MLPNFLCIGAPKSGTTTLYEILKQHSQIGVSSFKEPHFFDNDNNWERGLRWYEKTYFSHIKNESIIGEFTPSYLGCVKTYDRINDALGDDLKFVVILRNPIERAYSQYLHTKRDTYEDLGFLEALKEEKRRLREGGFEELLKFSYVSQGLYFKHLQEYLNVFSKEKLHVILFEDFIKNTKKEIKKLQVFLQIQTEELKFEIHSNPAKKARSKSLKKLMRKNNVIKSLAKKLIPSFYMRQKIRNYIHSLNEKSMNKEQLSKTDYQECYEKYFREDIYGLEKMLSVDLSHWKTCE